MATATYTKLKSGAWGVRVNGSVTAGTTVTVTKKDGSTKVETVAKVIFSGDGVSLCAISDGAPRGKVYSADKFNGYGARRGGYVRACKTGGNCSSIGSGRSCGGHDCDGW